MQRLRTTGTFRADTEILSSVPLQVLLYFNLRYAVVYLIVGLLLGEAKARIYGSFPVSVLIFVAWFGLEILRLVFGYSGNLNEKVPQLAAFFLLSIFPQFFIVGFLLAFQSPRWGIDVAMGVVMELFVVLEIGFGFVALRKLIHYQTTRFFYEH